MRAADQLRQAHRPGPPPPLRLGTVARLTTNGKPSSHFAFYAGWPKAMAAVAVAKKVFSQ